MYSSSDASTRFGLLQTTSPRVHESRSQRVNGSTGPRVNESTSKRVHESKSPRVYPLLKRKVKKLDLRATLTPPLSHSLDPWSNKGLLLLRLLLLHLLLSEPLALPLHFSLRSFSSLKSLRLKDSAVLMVLHSGHQMKDLQRGGDEPASSAAQQERRT